MKFPNLTIKIETTHLNDFNYDIINEITITMGIALSDCIKKSKKPSTIINAYSGLTSSEKNLYQSFSAC